MEVTRHQLGSGANAEFRARQLRARDMLRGDLDGPELQQHVEQSVLTTTIEKAGRWAVGNANFPLSFGLACCAIEWMSHIGPRIDIARFGFEAARATPRQADTIFLSGRISIKMAPVIRRIYEQMLEPRYVIAMGACSSSMGVFNNYALVPGDKFLPVDVHVPGCPPRPESLTHGILKLRAAILSQSDEGWRTRYGGRGTEEVVADLQREDPDADHDASTCPAGPAGRTRVPDATGLELIAQELRDADADGVLDTVFFRDQAALLVAPAAVPATLEHLRGKGFRFLASVHGVDYFPEEPRLGVHYELLDMHEVDRISVRTRVTVADPHVPSVTPEWPTADHQEREIYDMFGVLFDGHPDLRRILMPEDYEGHPQRRDFPIGGEPVLFTHNERETPEWWE